MKFPCFLDRATYSADVSSAIFCWKMQVWRLQKKISPTMFFMNILGELGFALPVKDTTGRVVTEKGWLDNCKPGNFFVNHVLRV